MDWWQWRARSGQVTDVLAIQEVSPFWQTIVRTAMPYHWAAVESPLGMILWNGQRLLLKQPATNDQVFPEPADRDNRRRNFRRYLQARGGKPHHPDSWNTRHCRV